MKLKYIITTLLATAVLATSCQEDIERHLSEVQVSSSYVAIPAEGGSKTITVTATAEWNIENVPSWLTVSPVSGVAGETEVSFKADAATSTNEVTLRLLCSGKTQELNVLQQTEKVDLPISTCKEVNSGTDGVTYRIKGTVTRIVNTTYGNMYVSDGTDEVYVYGTLDASGAEKNFLSLGIEAGDIVTVEGPRITYSGTIELKNVSVIAIEKSLIKVDSVEPESAELPVEGGSFTVTLTNKGDGVSVSVPADAKSWLTLEGISTSGTETVVKFEAAANEGGDRETTISFTTTSDGKEYSASASLSQKGAIIDAPTYTLTTDGLPTAYPTEETVVSLSGLDCYIMNVANYGSGIQFKRGGGYLANKTALKKIKTIKVTVTDGKTYYPDNLKLYAGTAEKPEGTALTGTSDATSTTFDLSGGDYTYFTITNPSNYAVYLGKIEITCEE